MEATGAQWKGDIRKAFSALSSSHEGLSHSEAKTRAMHFGPNAVADKASQGWLAILFSQFQSPLLLILVAATFISAFLGDLFDTLMILACIIGAVILGFFQEYKSEKALAALRKYFTYRAVVLRDKQKEQLDSRQLVPGDIVFLGAGDIVPADMRIIESEGLAINESVLTGESREVMKDASSVPTGSSPQEIKNGCFMGTTVVAGSAKCLVVSIGGSTFFGKTASLFSARVPESDFHSKVRTFGDMVFKLVLAMALFVFLVNYFLGHGDKNPLSDSILFALALAVGIAPEALPAIITISLTSGSMYLAKKKVITKKLVAIEDLGNMDVLCTDKTGTLTDESIKFERFVDLDNNDSHDVLEYAFLCNAAVGNVYVKGNPIDVAIRKGGIAKKIDVSRFAKQQIIPFDFVRRRMGQVVMEGKKRYLVVKGAPESVISACTRLRMNGKETPISRNISVIKRMISGYNREGFTTIAVAYREVPAKAKYSASDENSMVFLGFVLLSNPPKATVKATIERLESLGVSLKIVSGDDSLVTAKLCSDIGLKITGGEVATGAMLSRLKPKELLRAVEKYNVFARVTPDQKLRIVESLRQSGHVVGFMGDGINDAPALRTADVGISVDSASDVAKEASHIILLDKNLDVIADGVEEGRKIFGNITKYILYTMSANNGNMITVALSSFFLPFIPMLPSQILLNNLLSDIPMLSIAADNVDEHYRKKPQKWDTGMIMKFMAFFGLISTVFDLLLIGILFFIMNADATTFRTAWFLESLLSEIIIVFSLRTTVPFFRSVPSTALVAAAVGVIALTFAVVYFEPVATLFHFTPLPLPILGLIAAILAVYFAATELGKVEFYRWISPAQKE
ncbi:TPA: magnesium-translocating P-type ATPase [Candidatus Micrarchaeota archaeon]|nr:magnesium-translocating P-type ATPase [Candidatus Micrarchaeota archaeon]